MNILKFIWFLYLGILLNNSDIYVEARRHGGGIGGKIKGFFHRVGRAISTVGRKILDIPPKHRSRFDKYPLHILKYHQFIWKRFFSEYLNKADDGRPTLPSPTCWNVRCWMKRNQFKRYWYQRANIPIEGNNSPPFLHRRCRMPGTIGEMCRREHVRHDYYWRMFMWIGRYGFPAQPQRKRICITDYCRWKKKLWERYWKNYWIYASLVPSIRPYDFNWKFWFWRYKGNQMRLQQILSPALMAMGIHSGMMGGMMPGGAMMAGGMMSQSIIPLNGKYLTIEMKQALMNVMQRDLAQTMQLASSSAATLHRQQMALMMLMRMPAYPSALSAQMQMQSMMRNVQYQQHMQQYQMQQMLQQQIWGMASYLRGSCGCGMCSGSSRMHGGSLPYGTSMYYSQGGVMNPLNPGLMARQSYGSAMLGGIGGGTMPMMPLNPVNNEMELKMRVQALYAKNNLRTY